MLSPFNETSHDLLVANFLPPKIFDIPRKAIREISECVRSFTPYLNYKEKLNTLKFSSCLRMA